ncbi:avidin-like [Alligator mississippiensis]|uniref:avidin-like n=1 Tax=Alligator mississippiensis TaxID=8496 RepID=UPI0028780642|nr:avidin-like [Alligator mississippiensis]
MMREIRLPLALSLGLASLGVASWKKKSLCQEGEKLCEGQEPAKDEPTRREGSPVPKLLTRPCKCVLSGQWQNELGSQVHIFDVEADGSFSGEYTTAVSATQAPIRPALLRGSQQLHGEEQQPTFGFTVNWKSFSDSTTVFVGQCFVDKSGEESLRTMWLLREEVSSEKDDWKATRTGCNVFTRIA